MYDSIMLHDSCRLPIPEITMMAKGQTHQIYYCLLNFLYIDHLVAYDIWAALREKVPNVLGPCHTGNPSILLLV